MRACFLGLILSIGLFATALAAPPKTPAIDPAEFSRTASTIDPEAGAEIIYKQVAIDQSTFTHERTVTVQVHIFNQQGVDAFTKVEIPYESSDTVRAITARVVSRDGTVRELDRKEIYDREVIKVGRYRTRAKSFAPPGIAPGVILEYSYQHISDGFRPFFWFTYPSDVPTRHVRFRFQPIEGASLNLRFLYITSPKPPTSPDKDGFYNFEMRDLPAWKEEPFSPPTVNLQPSCLIYYALDKPDPPDVFWPKFSTALFTEGTRLSKKNKALDAALQKLALGNQPPDVKARAIFNFVRENVTNRALLNSADRKGLPENRLPADTLKNGSGYPSDINELFFALVSLAGVEARLVRCGDRSDMLFSAALTEKFVVSDDAVAVKIGDQWKLLQPGKPFIPFGMLDWRNSDTMILIGSKADGKLAHASGAEAAISGTKREASFKIDRLGTLSGKVTMTYFGLEAADLKRELAELDRKGSAEFIRDGVKRLHKDATVKNLTLVGANSHSDPVVVNFDLEISDYAERTGTRLFLQPAVFHKTKPPAFPETTRKFDIIFPFRHTDFDVLEFAPPEGFTLEAPSAPQDLKVANLFDYTVDIAVRRNGTLIYERKYVLNRIDIPAQIYPDIRRIFDTVRTRDQHTLTLKRKEATPTASPAPAEPAPTPTTPGELIP